MIDTRCGETRARLYCLATGALLDWVEAEQGDTLQKVGLVPAPGPAHLLYTLVRGGAGRLAGAMYHTRQGAWLWRLELGAEFCLQEDSLYSLYTPRGLLMFGRHAGDAGQVGEVTRHVSLHPRVGSTPTRGRGAAGATPRAAASTPPRWRQSSRWCWRTGPRARW